MNILSAKFKTGLISEKEIMYDGTPQVAFIGRSNVGKSTTINALLSRKKLVKTGKTPGKTKEINFFKVSSDIIENVYFVDLPGYGYAKISKNARLRLEKIIEWYLVHPISDLKLVILIIDSKAGLTEFDKKIIDLMYLHNRDFILVVNKIDKINQKKLNILNKEIKSLIPEIKNNKKIFFISAFKNKNINLLRDFIFNSLENI